MDALDDVPPTASEPVRVELDGCTVTCRLLTGGDLLAATAPGAAGAWPGALLAAAVLTAEREGAPVALIDLPAPVVDAVVGALARAESLRGAPAASALRGLRSRLGRRTRPGPFRVVGGAGLGAAPDP